MDAIKTTGVTNGYGQGQDVAWSLPGIWSGSRRPGSVPRKGFLRSFWPLNCWSIKQLRLDSLSFKLSCWLVFTGHCDWHPCVVGLICQWMVCIVVCSQWLRCMVIPCKHNNNNDLGQIKNDVRSRLRRGEGGVGHLVNTAKNIQSPVHINEILCYACFISDLYKAYRYIQKHP